MTRATTAKLLAKNSLLYLALGLAVVIAVPFLAGLALGVRLLVPVLLVAGTITLGVSPTFRRCLIGSRGGKSSW
jgi:hypothetical protein